MPPYAPLGAGRTLKNFEKMHGTVHIMSFLHQAVQKEGVVYFIRNLACIRSGVISRGAQGAELPC